MIGFAPVSPPDPGAEAAALALHDTLTKPRGSLGRLEEVALRIGLVLGSETPEFQQPQLVVFAGDHGLAARGVSTPDLSIRIEPRDDDARDVTLDAMSPRGLALLP